MTEKIPPVMVDTGKPSEPIVVAVSEFNGTLRLDVRHFWTPYPGPEIAPSKKGVNINLEHAKELYDAIGHVLSEAGVIGG